MDSYDLSEVQILIVYRNTHMLNLLRRIISEFGIRTIQSTEDIEKAEKMFATHQPDLVVSDWIPGSDSMRFLHTIRTPDTSPSPFFPIIVVSSYTEQENVIAARDLGMTEFLATPVSAKALYEHICAAIFDRRPFIKQEKFFGPDRRRHRGNIYKGKERRLHPEGEDSAPDPRDTENISSQE